MAQSTFSENDEYGFKRPEDFNQGLYDNFMSQYIRILTKRAQRWNTLKGDRYKKTSTLKRFVRKGIPSDHRLYAWMSTSGALELKNKSALKYEELKFELNKFNPDIKESIEIDLPRTFPDNIYFTDHNAYPKQLYFILAVFAHQNVEVGYCQGLNYIAGLLLLVTKNEEAAFWLLKCLVEQILPKYYISTMSGFITDLDVLNELVEKSDPEVVRHINRVGMPWAMGVSKWFICIYSEVLPTETVLRIWDCLFYEGSKILFRVALTLIKIHKEEILNAKELSDLILVFRNMRSHERVINCHTFMIDVFKLSGSLSNTTIEKLRRKYKK